MHYSYGCKLKKDCGFSKETTYTIAASLMELMNVNFHLHIDILGQGPVFVLDYRATNYNEQVDSIATRMRLVSPSKPGGWQFWISN